MIWKSSAGEIEVAQEDPEYTDLLLKKHWNSLNFSNKKRNGCSSMIGKYSCECLLFLWLQSVYENCLYCSCFNLLYPQLFTLI